MRPRQPSARPREVREEPPPFTPPRRRAAGARQPWELSLDFGAAFPAPAGRLEAKAGVLVHLRFGYRLLGSRLAGLYVGAVSTVASFRSDDSVTLNPEAAPEEQVTCQDAKTSSLWLAEAAVWAALRAFGDLRLVLGAAAGGGYGEYRQLARKATDAQSLTCSYDDTSAWTPSVAGWVQVGWIFGRDMEVLLGGGFRGLFSRAVLSYQDADGVVHDQPVFAHLGFLTAVFVHRF